MAINIIHNTVTGVQINFFSADIAAINNFEVFAGDPNKRVIQVVFKNLVPDTTDETELGIKQSIEYDVSDGTQNTDYTNDLVTINAL